MTIRRMVAENEIRRKHVRRSMPSFQLTMIIVIEYHQRITKEFITE